MNGKIIETRDLTYELYGIFADYLIDTNQFMTMDNKYSYENFLNFEKWQVSLYINGYYLINNCPEISPIL